MFPPGMWNAPPRTPTPAAPAANASATAAARYQADTVTAATPAELTGMLFTGALDRMGRARVALEAGKPGEANPHLTKAQDIVDELRSSLNPEAGELSVALDGVYTWVLEQLVTACVKGDLAALAQARQSLEPIAQAWQQALLGGGAQA